MCIVTASQRARQRRLYLHSQQLKSLRYSSPFLSQLQVVVLHVHVTPPLRRGTPTELVLADEGSVVTNRGHVASEAFDDGHDGVKHVRDVVALPPVA